MADTKNVLIIQGGWQGHEPTPVAQRFARMLERNGYSVAVSDTQEPLADAEALKALDLIVMSWTMGEIDHKYVENISRAVAAGTGLAGCHGGLCDAFRQDTDWQFMTGGQWVAHPGNDGTRYEQERRSLSAGADIVIATPGRLITHLSLGTLDLSRTTHLILDEADRMLDMGFSEDILTIAAAMPKERQTILFSATMPPRIEQLATSIMRNPQQINIAVSKPAEKIDHSVYVCRDTDKTRVIRHIFDENPPERVIVFASSKMKVKELAAVLAKTYEGVAAMHSDLDQKDRDEVMQRFRARHIKVLVATDIVARGIDIDDITMVINYDAPHDAEDYIHRIGRTARAGRAGKAFTLVGERDRYALSGIEKLLGEKIRRNALPEGVQKPPQSAPRNADGRKGRGGRGRGQGDRHRGKPQNKQGGKPKGGRRKTPQQGKPNKGE